MYTNVFHRFSHVLCNFCESLKMKQLSYIWTHINLWKCHNPYHALIFSCCDYVYSLVAVLNADQLATLVMYLYVWNTFCGWCVCCITFSSLQRISKVNNFCMNVHIVQWSRIFFYYWFYSATSYLSFWYGQSLQSFAKNSGHSSCPYGAQIPNFQFHMVLWFHLKRNFLAILNHHDTQQFIYCISVFIHSNKFL